MRVVRRSDDEVQLGLDDRWAVRLGGLTPEQIAVLTGPAARPDAVLTAPVVLQLEELGVLEQVSGRRSRPRTAPDGSDGPPTTGARDIEARDVRSPDARAAGAEPRAASVSTAIPPGTTPDAIAWGLLGSDGTEMVRARTRRTVGVSGLDRTGMQVAATLAASGVGTVLLDDDRNVTTDDVGVGGFRVSDLGSPRRQAAARVLRDTAPAVRVGHRGHRMADVQVVVQRDAIDPAVGLGLLADDTPHLVVVLRETDATVGPFVRPGRTPCLRCLDLHRADADTAWPTMLGHLTGPDVATDGRSGVPAVLAAVCAALAAAEVLTHLDGLTPRTVGAAFEVVLPAATPRVREWAVHPDCGCTALPD